MPSIVNNNEKQCASGGEAHSVRLLATRRRAITMNNNEASADAAAAMRARSALRARNPSSRYNSFGWECVGKLSHGLPSFAQRRADAATLCAGHKKARSDPPGRDTHSCDDGLNTQDSVTQVNPFSTISHAHTGAIICPGVEPELRPTGAAPGRRRSDFVRMKR
jgi:hypothetical protein